MKGQKGLLSEISDCRLTGWIEYDGGRRPIGFYAGCDGDWVMLSLMVRRTMYGGIERCVSSMSAMAGGAHWELRDRETGEMWCSKSNQTPCAGD